MIWLVSILIQVIKYDIINYLLLCIMQHGLPQIYRGVRYLKQSFRKIWPHSGGYIKSVISNIVIMMPDIGSYFNQYCGKAFILKNWPIANSYKECNIDKNIIFTVTWKKVLFQSWSQFLSEKVSCGDCIHRYCGNTLMHSQILVGKTIQQGL